MKIALFMIMCSAISSQCLKPTQISTHNNFYDCMTSGYEQALNKTIELEAEQVNEHKIYIKFYCTPVKEIES